MIKCDLGTVSLKGSVPLIQAELEAVIVSIREAFIQKFGEDVSKHPELLLTFDNKIDLNSMGS